VVNKDARGRKRVIMESKRARVCAKKDPADERKDGGQYQEETERNT